jgi:hypothetical protein
VESLASVCGYGIQCHRWFSILILPVSIPIDDVTQNINFNGFPAAGQSLHVSPTLSGLGITNKTIGSPRQIQMSLSFMF